VLLFGFLSPQQENPYGADRKANKLPQERRASDTDSFIVEGTAPLGHLTVSQVVEIFARRKANKEAWPDAKVASTYNLDKKDAEHLLQYFCDYNIVTIDKPDLRPKMEFHQLHE
jgi:hemolysin-activating ACP:hemolysin acyltransferase